MTPSERARELYAKHRTAIDPLFGTKGEVRLPHTDRSIDPPRQTVYVYERAINVSDCGTWGIVVVTCTAPHANVVHMEMFQPSCEPGGRAHDRHADASPA